jgi:MFS family permease
VLTAIKLCAGFGVLAFIFAAPIGFLNSLIYIMPLLWSLLFFGAALIPTATGVVVNSVGRELQAASSSMSQLIFNLGGYFCAPVISAAVMDQFEDEMKGMIWGFRVCLMWSFFGIIFIILAWYHASKKFENYHAFQDEVDGASSVDQ